MGVPMTKEGPKHSKTKEVGKGEVSAEASTSDQKTSKVKKVLKKLASPNAASKSTGMMGDAANDMHSSEEEQSPATTPRFIYHAAASYNPKCKAFNPQEQVFHFDIDNCEEPPVKRTDSERSNSGQDAFFITRAGATRGIAFGVADGVGGWIDKGYDSADFSHPICDYMALAAHNYDPKKTREPLTGTFLMKKGSFKIDCDHNIRGGGCTVCVGIATEHGVAHMANLGDSGFLHLRRNAVIFHSQAQSHRFNNPFHLSKPISQRAREVVGAPYPRDTTKAADEIERQLEHGDILVCASDGVWDNLFRWEILRIAKELMIKTGAWTRSTIDTIQAAKDLSPYTKQGGNSTSVSVTSSQATAPDSVQVEIARDIIAAARKAADTKDFDGPFALAFQENYPQENFHGGKHDDMCVIVVLVDGQSDNDMV